MGLAFSAFSLAYGIFEIPGGWLGDWLGPRKILMRVVVMWSAFTAATGLAVVTPSSRTLLSSLSTSHHKCRRASSVTFSSASRIFRRNADTFSKCSRAFTASNPA